METKELMAQNVQDPAQAGEVLLQPPKRPKKKRSIKKIVLLSLAGIAVLAPGGQRRSERAARARCRPMCKHRRRQPETSAKACPPRVRSPRGRP